ncbi:hypothetical protein [Roseivivax jejudonensis]|uniref:hypothetical protein n=1 Tax=Roseivivax jejudonensis TaxID=1529041 RepID=UPI00117B368E|nr:hypothetical protein [Roseivivax jejudonensis]
MKYLHRRKLFFLHVPKCAGMSLRSALTIPGETDFGPLADDLGLSPEEAERVTERGNGFDHPVLGRIHPAHLPLAAIRSELPRTWRALSEARPFAVVRAPRDRFVSALMQRLKEFRDAGAISADDPLVRREASAVCDWLSARDRFTDIEFVHFTRQVDYVDTPDGTRLCTVFPVEDMRALVDWIEAESGLTIEVAHTHSRRQPTRWSKSLQPAARFVGRRLLPRPVKAALHPLWMNSAAFTDAAQSYRDVDFGPDVEAFIADYYAADARLHSEALRRRPTPAATARASVQT